MVSSRVVGNPAAPKQPRSVGQLNIHHLLVVSLVAVVALAAVAVLQIGVADASPSSGDQIPATAVPINPDPNTGYTVTPGTPFSAGQTISVQVPANSVLSPTQAVKIVECAAPGGVLPTTTNTCDPAQTVQGDQIKPNADGSFTYDNYQTLALPDPQSGPSDIDCDLTDECVLYIGENYNDLSAPHFWSQGFYVAPNATDSGINPGDGSPPSAATTPSGSLSTVAAGPSSAVADGNDASTVTVTLLGLNGQNATVPIAGAPVSLSQGSGHSVITPTSATTSSSGVAEFTVTDTTPESVGYQATSGSVAVNQTASVTFEAPTASATRSTVTASPTSVPANGTSSSTVTVTIVDQAANPRPMAGISVALAKSTGTSATITPSSDTTDASGEATFSVTDSTVEPVTFTATAGAVTLSGSAAVTFGVLAVSASSSTVVAAESTAPIGATAGTTVTVTLLTADGTHPVAGKAVSLTGTGSSVVNQASVDTNASGAATFTVTDSAVESAIFSATDVTDGVNLETTAAVSFETPPPPTPSATLSTMSAAPTSLVVDGSSASSVFVTIKDSSGNALPNKVTELAPTVPDVHVEITAQVPPGGTQPGVTGSTGEATFEVLDPVAETVTLTATDTTDNITLSTQVSITFLAGPADANQSTVSVSPDAVAADGHTPATVTVTLCDHFGNGISGKSIKLVPDTGSSVISPPTATTNAAGTATFTVTDGTNELVTYSAVDVDDGNLLVSKSAPVTFGAPPPTPADPNASAIAANYSAVPADGTTAATITVWLYDSGGSPLAGRTVTLSGSGGQSVVRSISPVTNASGIATFAVSDAHVESQTYRATDTSDNVAVAGLTTIQFLAVAASQQSGTPVHLNQPVVGMASTPDGHGYWLVAADGGVFRFGDAGFFGSLGAVHLNQPVVGMASTPDGHGYWLVAADGGVFRFGDAGFFGSLGAVHLNQPVVGMASTPDGHGYWLVAADGGVFRFGDAGFFGSLGAVRLNKPVVGMASTPDGHGYWLVAADGGVFRFGDAGFFGSLGAVRLNKSVVGMALTPDGNGYWLVAADGGVFRFGDAGFFGSLGAVHLNGPIVGMDSSADGHGYWLAGSDGGLFNAGDALFFGAIPS